MDQELELAFSAAEAEVHCKVLIEQRKNLSAQHRKLVAKLKRLSERPPTKVQFTSSLGFLNISVVCFSGEGSFLFHYRLRFSEEDRQWPYEY